MQKMDVKLDKVLVKVKHAVIQLDASGIGVNQSFNQPLNSVGVIPSGRSVRKRKHNPIARMLVNGNCLVYQVKGRVDCNLFSGDTSMDTPVITFQAIGREGNRRNYDHGQKRKKLLAMIEDPKPAGYSLWAAVSNISKRT